jgi:sec-independent protein translocase protein TatA
MKIMFAGMLGGWEIVLILAVVLILFGAKKLPELAKGLGTGIKEFKKATSEITNEISTAMNDRPQMRARGEINPAILTEPEPESKAPQTSSAPKG